MSDRGLFWSGIALIVVMSLYTIVMAYWASTKEPPILYVAFMLVGLWNVTRVAHGLVRWRH